MQSRAILRLARRLRNFHKANKSWRKTALTCHVLTSDGKSNPGLAKRIATNRYEPGPDTFQRLSHDGALGAKKSKARVWHDLWSMNEKQRAYLLEHREAMV